jgi:hypothetical protein
MCSSPNSKTRAIGRILSLSNRKLFVIALVLCSLVVSGLISGNSIEALREYNASFHVAHISPTPFLMTVAETDVLTPTDLALEAYSRAREPKQLNILPGGHFDTYSGSNFENNAGCQAEFLRKTLSK